MKWWVCNLCGEGERKRWEEYDNGETGQGGKRLNILPLGCFLYGLMNSTFSIFVGTSFPTFAISFSVYLFEKRWISTYFNLIFVRVIP